LGEFLKNPEKYLASLDSPLYYPSVTNLATKGRVYELGLDRKELLEFLGGLLRTGKMSENALLILAEYQENAFGGNLIINPASKELGLGSGAIYTELVTGTHAGLAYYGSSPIIRGQSNLFNKLEFEVLLTEDLSPSLLQLLIAKHENGYVDLATFKERCENCELTQADKDQLAYYEGLTELLLKTLNYIPKNRDEEGTETYYPGYYEYIINCKGEVRFIDWREDKNYQMINSGF
jgi:hypothetical protein